MFIRFISTVFLAAIGENLLLTYALGFNRWLEVQSTEAKILKFSAVFTWVAFFSTLLNMGVIVLLQHTAVGRYLRAILFLVNTLLVYFASYLLVKKYLPNWFEELRRMLPRATFNTALFGIFYIVLNRMQGSGYSVWQLLVFPLAAGAGYAFGLIMVLHIKKRMALAPVPKSLQGTPVLLIALGLLSLAVYGLIGYGGTVN